MRAYSTGQSGELYYFKENVLLPKYETGSVCVVAPGDVMWASDLEALRLIREGKDAQFSLQTVVAKYLLNEGTGEF